MLDSNQVEEIVSIITSLDRAALIEQFRTYPSKFPVDFTPKFLETQPIERLRHLFLALCLHTQRMPESVASAA